MNRKVKKSSSVRMPFKTVVIVKAVFMGFPNRMKR